MKQLLFLLISISSLGCEIEAQPLPGLPQEKENFSRSLSDAELQDSLFWSVYGKCQAALSIIENLDVEIIPAYGTCKWEMFGVHTMADQIIALTESALVDWDNLKLIASGKYGYQKYIVEWRDPYVQQSFEQTIEWTGRLKSYTRDNPCGVITPPYTGILRMMYRMQYLVDDHLAGTARIFQRY